MRHIRVRGASRTRWVPREWAMEYHRLEGERRLELPAGALVEEPFEGGGHLVRSIPDSVEGVPVER